MNPDLEKIVENAKEWSLERITTSRCLCVGPCLFLSALPVATNVNASLEINIYDGQGDQGDLKATIKQIYTFPCCCLVQAAYFRRGLYIDLTTNAAAASVMYLPLRD